MLFKTNLVTRKIDISPIFLVKNKCLRSLSSTKQFRHILSFSLSCSLNPKLNEGHIIFAVKMSLMVHSPRKTAGKMLASPSTRIAQSIRKT